MKAALGEVREPRIDAKRTSRWADHNREGIDSSVEELSLEEGRICRS